jgi:putative ABC transport system substrate-binding protein
MIVALNTRAVLEAQRATKTIPIVFASISDPLGSGIVTSLAHPGGNTTGISVGLDDTVTKQLDLMRTTVRPLARLGVLINPDNPLFEGPIGRLQGVARSLGVAVRPFSARTLEEIPAAFTAMSAAGIQAVIVFDDSLFVNRAREIADAAIAVRLPTIAGNREYVDAGVLYSYGGLIVEQFKRTAYYVDKIFKGARPGDLPVEQPTHYFFVINQKTAKAIGLTVPGELLLRADASIE